MSDTAIYIGIAAAAGLLGYQLGRKATPPGGGSLPPPGPGPLPPLPPPATSEPAGDAPPGTYSDRWDGFDFDVEVYPEAADPTRISPPTGPARPAAARDCSIIALPSGWWDRVGNIAEQLIASGETERGVVAQMLMSEMLPDCYGARTPAVAAVELEMLERLRPLLPDTSQPPGTGQGGIHINPRRSRRSRGRTRTIRR